MKQYKFFVLFHYSQLHYTDRFVSVPLQNRCASCPQRVVSDSYSRPESTRGHDVSASAQILMLLASKGSLRKTKVDGFQHFNRWTSGKLLQPPPPNQSRIFGGNTVWCGYHLPWWLSAHLIYGVIQKSCTTARHIFNPWGACLFSGYGPRKISSIPESRFLWPRMGDKFYVWICLKITGVMSEVLMLVARGFWINLYGL